jgi:hypothetical protein
MEVLSQKKAQNAQKRITKRRRWNKNSVAAVGTLWAATDDIYR